MKHLFLLLCVVWVITTNAQEERKNQFGVSYSLGACEFASSPDLLGAPSYNGKNYFTVGLDYSYEIVRNFELSAGINYSKNNMEIHPNLPPNMDNSSRPFDIELISIPILAKYRFFNYFFFNGGAYINTGVSDNDKYQTGIGLGAGLGLGAEYTFAKCINIFINPYFQWNGIVPQEDFQLLNQGVRMGVGYKF